MKTDMPKAEEYSLMESLESKNGRLGLGDSRVVLMTEQAYAFLLQVINEHAPQAIKYAFYDMGYRVGQELMGTLKDRADDPERAFKYFVETFRQAGYGDITVTSFDLSKPEARLRGTNLFESGLAKQSGIYRSPRTVDHYSRGMFAGFMSVLLGREVVCEEMACEFRGDGACEFIILPFST